MAVCAAAVLLFGSYILLYKLGNEPFQDYDEATYAEVTHESIEQGNPSRLTFLYLPYFRKPPLLFWMTTASAQVFKDVEFADRFPSALAGLAAAVIVALICIEAGAGVWTGLFAAAILATTAGWMEFARDVRFDTLVALFDVAAFYAALRASRDSRWFWMVGITLALAVLSKSVIALFGGIAVLAVLVYERKFIGAFRDRNFWLGIGVFVLVAAPWHIYMTLTYGGAFWHSYVGMEVFDRAAANLFPGGGNPTNTQYLEYLRENAAPWWQLFVLLVLSAPLLLRRLPQRIRSAFEASIVAVLAVFAVAFGAKTKAFGYLIPLFPFLAVAVALAGWALWQWGKKKGREHADTIRAVLIAVTIVLIAYAAALTRYEALHLDPYYIWELSQAYEEYDVGEIIRSAPEPTVYTYGGYDFLGSIYYYSGIPDTPNPYILLWSASSTPAATSTNFILATSSLESLSKAFPRYRFTQDYSGRFVSLFTVVPAAAR